MAETPQTPYEAGQDAYHAGLPIHEGNPYTPLSGDWHEWQQGWSDAQDEAL